MSNPLLNFDGLPQYDQVLPEHVQPALDVVLAEAEQRLANLEAEAPASYAEFMPLYEAINDQLGRVWGVVGHLLSVRNSDELRQAHEQGQPRVIAFGTKVGQSQPLYQAFLAMKNGAEWQQLSPAQQRIIETELRDFTLSGIGLEGDKRERFNAIRQELSQLQTTFSNRVLDANKAFLLRITDAARLAGIPDRVRSLLAANAVADGEDDASAESGPWVFTLDIPCFMPVMQHAEDRDLRAQLHEAYATRASTGDLDNSELIGSILTLRKEYAELLGFATWAERSLSTKMASSVDEVEGLLERLRAASTSSAEADIAAATALAKEAGAAEADDMRAWDMTFWFERLREQRFSISDEELRPYFPLPKVQSGLFALAKRLFDVDVRAANGDAPVWHEDVEFFWLERDGQPVAGVYLDPYARPAEKRGGAWMNGVQGRSSLSDGLQVDGRRLPVALLVCNQTPPSAGKPSLMSFREVETLFHEFGHGLQHMLTKVTEGLAAGINKVEWDAVELPSQFMENWCYHKETLMGMSAHVETGAPLPEDLYQKICAARTYNAGGMMLRQLQFGRIDLELHHRWNGEESVHDVSRRIAEAVLVRAPEAYDRFLCSFAHIFAGGYSAGYYSYKWAEILSADAFAAFEEEGLEDETAVAKLGAHFAETVLGLGGSKPAADVFREFRGRDPSPEPLLRHAGLLAAS